mgnify:CR=1 FL=1
MPVLEISQQDRVLRLTLNRPDKRHALSHELSSALVAAFARAASEPAVGAILLDATGPAFCAGMDLEDASSASAVERTAIHEQLFTLRTTLRKPLIAAVNGPALGGGLGLAAQAHIVIAAQGATFGLPEIRLAMWPFFIWRSVTAALGERRTLEMALTGRIFGSNEAAQYGLVHEVVPPIELDDRATAVAELVSQYSPFTLERGLSLAAQSRELSDSETLALAARLRAEVFASPDFHEGVTALQQKRRPVWPSISYPKE